VPAGLAARYAVFTRSQRSADKLSIAEARSLNASGLIMSGSRLVGNAAFGARIYLVPAEHLLSLRLAPARCLSRVNRLVEQESLNVLRDEYRQPALCVVLLGRNHVQECGPAAGNPYPLLSAGGTPGFGLVPNGVNAVTVSYFSAPPQTVTVRHNFFAIANPAVAATPCGVQWLDPTGNVQKTATGCSYLALEKHELSRYWRYVESKLGTLRAQVAQLSEGIGSGDMAQARSDWLAAHLTWLEIGQDDGAYGCFGSLGGQIDGLAAGHRLGTAAPDFTGFHRIEFDLWNKHDLEAAARGTTVLQRLLTQLLKHPMSAYLPATATGIGGWVLRPHEVLEDALRDSLSSDDDYGSNSDLASLTADMAAVRQMLSDLAPGLRRVAPHLIVHARTELSALNRATLATGARDVRTPLASLPVRARQQIDADLDAALETLAPLPDLITSTGSNAPSS
jgi:iron uptake system EfeUOB component EfeO/EfeM